MPISKIKSSAIDANAITGAGIADGSVTSADLDTNIAITGDLTVDTNTFHVDSTNNSVGIGTSTDTAFSDLNIKTSLGSSPTNASASGAIRLTSTATAGVGVGPSIMFRGQTGNSTSEYSFSSIQGVKSSSGSNDYSGDLVFYTQNSGGASAHNEQLRILSGGGITFNGDTAAANALDDYEEGDFAYTMPFSTSGSMTVRSGYERGYYTKVGRMVTIHLRFESQGNSGSLSGDLRIAGFPFTFTNVTPTNSNVSYVYPLHLRGVSSTSFDYDLSFYFLADPGTNYGRLIGQGEGNTHAQAVITSGDIPTNVEGTLSFTYLVNA